MKRVKNEHIVGTVSHYLKRRQYAELDLASCVKTAATATTTAVSRHGHQQQQQQLPIGLQEMTVQGAVNCETGVRNAIGFSSVSRDETAVDQQFNRLKAFTSEASEPCRSELTNLLFPVFVQLYLELITNGLKTPAHKFRCRHQGLFADVAEYRTTIESLANVQSSQDLSKHPNIKTFRESKYTVRLSEDSLTCLIRYLTQNDHLILLQILNLHIDVKVQSSDRSNLYLYEDQAKGVSGGGGGETSSIKGDSKSDDVRTSGLCELEPKSLESAIRKVNDGPPSLPSICLYTFTNTFQGLSSVCLSSDVSLIAGGFEDSAIRLWKLTPTLPVGSGDVSGVIGSNVSRFRLACDMDARRWNDRREDDRKNDREVVDVSSSEMKTMRAHSGPVYGVCFVPDTRLLLSCSEDTSVRAWSTESHSALTLYRGHNYPVWDIDCSSIGTYFATASQDRTAKLWYLDRAYPVRIFAGHTLDVDCIKFHPNANYLATGSSDKSVRLWNVQEARMVRMFQGHRGTVFTLAFSPDGQLLASAGEDRRIRIWDLAAGGIMKELRGHIDTVYSLCFSRDSSTLASGGLDGTIRLWDVRKGGISVGNQIDNHTSAELLGSYAAKSLSFPLLHYSFHNLLIAAGTRVTSSP